MDQILFIFLKCVFDFISFFRLFVCFIEMMCLNDFLMLFLNMFFWCLCICFESNVYFYKQIKKYEHWQIHSTHIIEKVTKNHK